MTINGIDFHEIINVGKTKDGGSITLASNNRLNHVNLIQSSRGSYAAQTLTPDEGRQLRDHLNNLYPLVTVADAEEQSDETQDWEVEIDEEMCLPRIVAQGTAVVTVTDGEMRITASEGMVITFE